MLIWKVKKGKNGEGIFLGMAYVSVSVCECVVSFKKYNSSKCQDLSLSLSLSFHFVHIEHDLWLFKDRQI